MSESEIKTRFKPFGEQMQDAGLNDIAILSIPVTKQIEYSGAFYLKCFFAVIYHCRRPTLLISYNFLEPFNSGQEVGRKGAGRFYFHRMKLSSIPDNKIGLVAVGIAIKIKLREQLRKNRQK